jgi:hypothetical protein
MEYDAETKARADAERLLAEFGPNPDEAKFIREHGEAIFTSALAEFRRLTRDGSVRMRPATLEMAIAYPAFAAAAWARDAEPALTKEQNEKTS